MSISVLFVSNSPLIAALFSVSASLARLAFIGLASCPFLPFALSLNLSSLPAFGCRLPTSLKRRTFPTFLRSYSSTELLMRFGSSDEAWQ